MAVISAGILVFRKRYNILEFLLIHPGGPYWQNKDENAWSIPKGLVEKGEDELQAAIREFKEETGFEILTKEFIELDEVKQPGGKVIKAWAIESDFDQSKLKSNTFNMEWPPKSGRLQEFPEADKGGWFNIDMAKNRIVRGQIKILENLIAELEKRAL